MILEWTIPGQPRPWKRVAIVRTKKGGFRGVKEPTARAHQKWIAAHALRALNQATTILRWHWPKDARYSVMIDVWERDGKRGDVDNLAKNVLDSCNRVLWDDDRQVDQLAVCRHPPDKANPRTVVRVERVTP